MKNIFKALGIIALVVVIGLSMVACGGDDDSGGGGNTGGNKPGGGGGENVGLDGTWENQDTRSGWRVTVSGSTGVLSRFTGGDAIEMDAKNKGIIKIGDPYWRNIKSTGDGKWSGEVLSIISSPGTNEATGITWASCTFSISASSASGNTIITENNAGGGYTWRRYP